MNHVQCLLFKYTWRQYLHSLVDVEVTLCDQFEEDGLKLTIHYKMNPTCEYPLCCQSSWRCGSHGCWEVQSTGFCSTLML